MQVGRAGEECKWEGQGRSLKGRDREGVQVGGAGEEWKGGRSGEEWKGGGAGEEWTVGGQGRNGKE